MLSSSESSFKTFYCSHKFLDLLRDSLLVLLVRVSFVVGDAVDSEMNRLLDFPPSAKCDSLKHPGQSFRPANFGSRMNP